MDQEFLGREQILGAQDRTYEVVDTKEWGGKVRIQSLNGAERQRYELSVMTGKGKNRDVDLRAIREKLAALTIVDAEGNLLFAPSDIQALADKNAAALDRVFAASQKLSGISPQDMEELEKNSETVLSDGSISV